MVNIGSGLILSVMAIFFWALLVRGGGSNHD